MVPRSKLSTLMLAAVATTIAACGSGSGNNAAPRVTSVPLQSTTGDSAFSLDLGDYVADREAATLTYSVASGGGSFAGSVYTNTFDTMGEHTVEFSVTDGVKVTTGSFVVRVTEANFAVVGEDTSGLLLLDTRTNEFVRVAAAAASPTFAAGMGDGRLVYQTTGGAGSRLWVFDPLTRTTAQVDADEPAAVTERAVTSDNSILYAAGTSADNALRIYNPRTGVTRQLSRNVVPSVTVLVNDAGLVFYEVAVNGQDDIYGYEPATDDSFAVGTAPTAEALLAVLPNGGIVFSRVGGSGETDLFYYRVSTGLVEIGLGVTGLDTRNKTYCGYGTGNQVVFSALNGTDEELYFWNPANGQTTAIATGANHAFVAIGAGNEVVYNTVVSSTEKDASFYDLDNATTAVVRNGSDVSLVLGVSGDGTTNYAFVRPSGTTSSVLAVSLVASPATATWAAGSAVATTLGVLANGDVVAQRASGAGIDLFDVSAGTWATPITGTGLAFAGQGLANDDFVYTVTVSGQTDLSMWDASAGNSVVVSDTTGNDVWRATTLDGTVLFTRVVAGNTNADLFVWDGSTSTRLTAADGAGLLHDHTVLGSYTGAR